MILVPHDKAHFDDLIACFLTERLGVDHFGEEIKTVHYDATDPIFNLTAAELEPAGIIPIGWGKGWADDHDPEEREKTCATKKVADKLNLWENPNVKELAEYALHADTTDSVHPLSLPTLIKTMNSLCGFTKRKRIYAELNAVFDFYIEHGYEPGENQASLFDRTLSLVIIDKFGKKKYNGINNFFIVYGNKNQIKFQYGKLTVELEKGGCAAWEIAKSLKLHRAGFLYESLAYAKGYYKKNKTKNKKWLDELTSLSTSKEEAEKHIYKKILDVFTSEETVEKSAYSKFALGGLLEMLQQNKQVRLEKVFFKLLSIYLDNQILFFRETPKAFAASKIKYIRGSKDTMLKVCVSKSSDPRLQKFARLQGCNIVVQQNPETGGIAIFSNEPLYSFSAMVRYYEQKKSGSIEIKDISTLKQIGIVDGIPQWYLMPNGRMLLNGSLSHHPIPSKLKLEEVFNLLRITMDQRFFYKDSCGNGICVNPEKCRLKQFELFRCQKSNWSN